MFRGKSYIETQRTNAALTERLELIEKENVRLKEQKINLSTEVKSCRATNKNLKTATLNMVKCFGDKDVPVDCDEIESFLEDE
jgi:U3 small nucleolar ribonucleoprotein component